MIFAINYSNFLYAVQMHDTFLNDLPDNAKHNFVENQKKRKEWKQNRFDIIRMMFKAFFIFKYIDFRNKWT